MTHWDRIACLVAPPTTSLSQGNTDLAGWLTSSLMPPILTFPTKVPSDSLGWIGSLKRTSDKSLFPMALGSCGHRITHQLRPINMNGRSILAVTSILAFIGRSIADCRGAWTGQEGTRSVASRPALSRAQPRRRRSLPCLPAMGLALQDHDAVVDATTDFHTRILSRLVIWIKSTLLFVEVNR